MDTLEYYQSVYYSFKITDNEDRKETIRNSDNSDTSDNLKNIQ